MRKSSMHCLGRENLNRMKVDNIYLLETPDRPPSGG